MVMVEKAMAMPVMANAHPAAFFLQQKNHRYKSDDAEDGNNAGVDAEMAVEIGFIVGVDHENKRKEYRGTQANFAVFTAFSCRRRWFSGSGTPLREG